MKHRLGALTIILALLLSALAPALGPHSASAQGSCGDAPAPQLTPGGWGMVTFTDGRPLNVRTDPSRGSALIGQLPEGTQFWVVSGPVCADDIYWWQIEAGNLAGWAAEGASGEYFVAPMVPPGAATPVPGAPLPIIPLGEPRMAFAEWGWESLMANAWGQGIPDPLALQLPPTYAGDLPPLPIDLSQVQFVDDAGLNAAQRALLAQNGFVVVPGGLAQFGDAYREDEVWGSYLPGVDFDGDPALQPNGHAFFVTTDSMLHVLHYVFDNLLTDLERATFVPLMRDDVLRPVLLAAQGQRAEAAGTALEVPARDVELFLAVALELFDPGAGIAAASPDLAGEISALVTLANAGSGQAPIPFLPGYLEDFSQYRPRGHYEGDPALEQYFRGMMWLSRLTFRASEAADTQRAVLLLRALRGSPQAVQGWNAINGTLGFLIGPIDDLSMTDYSPLADAIYGPLLPVADLADPARLAAFQDLLKDLPGPRVNGLILPNDTTAEEVQDETRGFRFLGQRFTLDAYAMQELIYPKVGTRENPRLLPLGLDVASAVGGSEIAYRLAIQAGAGDFENYDVQTLRLASEVGVLTDAEWLENVYGGWLWALRPLWERGGASFPMLMETEAWLRKDLQTGLASWTELKHDTVLYAKQATGFGGGGAPMLLSFGYVEPNPAVFARIAVVAALTYQGLVERNFKQDDVWEGPEGALSTTLGLLRGVAAESARFAEMARKELAGEPLSENDLWTIYGYGNYLWMALYTLYQGSGQPDPVALVTDVASNPSAQIVLQEAVGPVDYIYVVVPNTRGGLQVVRGGVFSYFEWVGDINQRMTDSEWRAQVAAGDLPARPDWVGAFYSE